MMATSFFVPALFLGLILLANARKPALKYMTNERKLFHALVDDYEPSLRPVNQSSSRLKVQFGLALLHIDELDIKSSELSTTVWMRQLWNDDLLKWNPEKFGSLDHIRLPVDRIWTPDLHVYNTRGKVQLMDGLSTVDNSGDVLYITSAKLLTHCSTDVRYFPYDTQTCFIKVASWTYDGFKVDLDFYDSQDSVDLNDYIASSEWEILEAPAKKNVKYYPCCMEPYPDLTFSLKLRRLSTYYSYVFISPAVAVSLLIPFMFLLPASSRQKIQLGGFIILSKLLLLWMLTNSLPSVGVMRPPLLIMYSLANLLLCCVSVVMNVFLESVYYNNRNKNPPALLKKIFLTVLGKVVCVCSASSCQPTAPTGNIGMSYVQAPGESFSNEPAGGSSNDSAGSCMVPVNEWSLICTVLDRLLFLIFLILSIVLCCMFL